MRAGNSRKRKSQSIWKHLATSRFLDKPKDEFIQRDSIQIGPTDGQT